MRIGELVNLKSMSGRVVAVGVFVVAVLVLAACGGGKPSDDQSTVVAVADGAPAYCQQLASLPTGLPAAVGNAAAGKASDGDKSIIEATARQLDGALEDRTIPSSVRTTLAKAADQLDKLSKGHPLGGQEATTFNAIFQDLGKAVEGTCAVK